MDDNQVLLQNKIHLTRLGSSWGGVHLDLELVPRNSLVISAGLAFDISFDEEIIKRKNCYVVGVDPTLKALAAVNLFKMKNFTKRKHLRIVRKAVHGKTGLIISLGGPANTFLSPFGSKSKTISLEDLVASYSGAAILKLDIEGAEFPAIELLTMKFKIPQIAIGFHIWLNTESDLYPNEGVVPNYYRVDDVLEAVDKIKAMGYKLVYEEHGDDFRIGQETLFIRNDFAEKYTDLVI